MDSELPLPPAPLMQRVAGTDNPAAFNESGALSVQDLQQALASIGKSFSEFNKVLEWGCGCGRILRHLPRPAGGKEIHGNDIDREAIDWVNTNLPWVRTSSTNGMPPLPYDDNSFDLIFNHSVLSHLDEFYQDAWLAELNRVLKPGAILTLTVHGPTAFQSYLDSLPASSPARSEYMQKMHSDGLLYITDDQWASHGFPDFYHSTFHENWYVFAHWSEFLRLRSYIVRGALDWQDPLPPK